MKENEREIYKANYDNRCDCRHRFIGHRMGDAADQAGASGDKVMLRHFTSRLNYARSKR